MCKERTDSDMTECFIPSISDSKPWLAVAPGNGVRLRMALFRLTACLYICICTQNWARLRVSYYVYECLSQTAIPNIRSSFLRTTGVICEPLSCTQQRARRGTRQPSSVLRHDFSSFHPKDATLRQFLVTIKLPLFLSSTFCDIQKSPYAPSELQVPPKCLPIDTDTSSSSSFLTTQTVRLIIEYNGRRRYRESRLLGP